MTDGKLEHFLKWGASTMSILDLVMLALGLGFFAVAVGYSVACDRL